MQAASTLIARYNTSPELQQIVRFLFAGGFAAAVNWLIRIGLSFFMPFWLAVLLAYMIGMSVGYTLYSRFVFQGPRNDAKKAHTRIVHFLSVNAFSAVIVLGLSLALAYLLTMVLPLFFAEAIAHGIAIFCGAVTNYIGHKVITFD
ncbi:MAG: GtrA family protein [Hyphomicrobiales bacterium]|nr:MAG: GtrA family protein [Hyphomicrobiales bacterium]